MPARDDTVRLIVGGQEYTGWTSVRVERSVEQVPGHFTLTVSEPKPMQGGAVVIPGDPCEVKLGDDLVIGGFVNCYVPSISATSHDVSITGRSKFQDLIDCNILTGNNTQQISAASFKALCQKLLDPFSLTAKAPDGDGPQIPQFNALLTQTPWQVIDEVARYARKLVYDDVEGNLVIADIGKQSHASGVTEGVNMEAAQVTFDNSNRFSVYIGAYNALNTLAEINGNNEVVRVRDPTVLRYRPKVIVSEQSVAGVSLAESRARWHMGRSIGRSQIASITVDSWRDSAGKLWTPNTRIPLHIPSCKLLNRTWVIASVAFTMGTKGRRAEITAMPKEAFEPAPSPLFAVDADLDRAFSQANGTSTPARQTP